jgi:21S rRNA (uridine2791-2'-O)-methyltransferase
MEINEKYKIFKKGQTVVDLGFAPGAWSQVAISNVGPRGRVLGIDILPATPPKGVSSMQANFLSRRTHNAIISYLSDPDRGRRISLSTPARKDDPEDAEALAAIEDALEPESYIDLEKRVLSADALQDQVGIHRDIEATRPKLVDVVLSDMFVPLPTSGAYHARQYLMAHYRMSNTTGLKAADHGASIV